MTDKPIRLTRQHAVQLWAFANKVVVFPALQAAEEAAHTALIDALTAEINKLPADDMVVLAKYGCTTAPTEVRLSPNETVAVRPRDPEKWQYSAYDTPGRVVRRPFLPSEEKVALPPVPGPKWNGTYDVPREHPHLVPLCEALETAMIQHDMARRKVHQEIRRLISASKTLEEVVEGWPAARIYLDDVRAAKKPKAPVPPDVTALRQGKIKVVYE